MDKLKTADKVSVTPYYNWDWSSVVSRKLLISVIFH